MPKNTLKNLPKSVRKIRCIKKAAKTNEEEELFFKLFFFIQIRNENLIYFLYLKNK